MSRLDKVLNINRDFVSRKGDALKDIYSDTSSDMYKKIHAAKMDTELKFSEMSAEQIKQMVNIQLIPENKIGSVPEPSPIDGLSYDAQVLYNDVLNWILERKAKDTKAALTRLEEKCNVAAQTCDTVITGLDTPLKFVFDIYKDYKAKKLQPEIKGKINDRLKKLKGFKGSVTPTGVKAFRKENESWFNVANMEPIPANNANKEGTTYKKCYKFEVLCHIDNNFQRIEYKGSAVLGKRHITMANGLIDKLEALLSADERNYLKYMEHVFKIVRLCRPITEVIKGFKTIETNEEVRKLNRAADCTRTIPIIKEGNMSYVKGGYYVDKDKKVKKISDET